MMQLPATIEEAAQKLIRAEMGDFVRYVVLDRWPRDSAETRALVHNVFRQIYRVAAQSTVELRLDIIRLALEVRDPDAYAVLCEINREYESSGERKPAELAYFAMEITDEKWRFTKRKSKKTKDYLVRNLGIVYAVAALWDRYGLSPMGRSSHTISGCSIVAEVLNLSYSAIEKVWLKYEGAAPIVPGFWAA